jgi:hypothetical protein
MTDTPTQSYRCAYCGSMQTWDGIGTPVCSQCGATQKDMQKTTASVPISRQSRIVIIVAAVVLVVVGATLFFVLRQPAKPAAPAPIIDGTKTSSANKGNADSTPTSSRIIRVDNPHIRVIPANVPIKLEDLLAKPEGAPADPDFDTHAFVIQTPRRMRDERLMTVFLGELTNTSPNMVAVAPELTLTLFRGGKMVDTAKHFYPDITPGAHVPLFFRYSDATKAFDHMQFVWKTPKRYTAGSSSHPNLTTSIQSKKLMSVDDLPGTHIFKYLFQRVECTVTNTGDRDAENVKVYLVLRDAHGQITGYDREDITDKIPPGGSNELELSAPIWADAMSTLEVVAFPTTPPSL